MKPILKSFMPAVLLLCGLTTIAQNRQINFEEGKWEQVLAKAKAENKLVYLDCYTTWCGPCKWMAKNIFTKDSVADFYNSKFVNVEIDMEKGEGKDLAKKYGIRAYPTMLYVNANGEVMHRTCGSCGADKFIQNGMAALDPEQQMATFSKKFGNGNVNGAIAHSYISLLDRGCQSYETELDNYFATQKESDLTSRSNWQLIYDFVEDYASKEFVYLENNREAFSKLYTADSVKEKINKVYVSGLSVAVRKKQDKDYEAMKQKIKASGNPDAERIILDADLKYYQRENDWKKFGPAAVTLIENYAKDNAAVLNNLAWAFYERIDDKQLLEKAADWAKHSCELENSYPNNDTRASVLYKLKRKEEAKAAAEKAIELAKLSGENFKETEELLKKINQLK